MPLSRAVTDSNAGLRDFLDAVSTEYGLNIDEKRMHLIAQTLSQNGIILVGHLKTFEPMMYAVLDIPDNLAQAVQREFSGASSSSSSNNANPQGQGRSAHAPPPPMQNMCGICQAPIPGISVVLSCRHTFCGEHLNQYINKLVADGHPIDMKCPAAGCSTILQHPEIKQALLPQELDRYDAACFQAWSSENMIDCPNPNCSKRISVANNPVPANIGPITECDDNGNVLSEVAYRAFMQHRIRCRDCQTNFCVLCKESPYHKGFDCKGFIEYKNARKCRFCEEPLDASNSVKVPPGTPRSLADVCNDEDCSQRGKMICPKILACGCYCGGIKGETTCLPCLSCDLKIDDEFCHICFTEALSAAPCIRLDCKHVVHFHCAQKKVTSGYIGARINFGFLDCPDKCCEMKHPALSRDLQPHLDLKNLIGRKAMERLVYEKLDRDPKITVDRSSDYFGKPKEYAMHRYLFFKCFKCRKPYFGGAYECGGADVDVDHADLVCPKCQPKSENVVDCKEHGSDWLTFKCRFCCNVANYYCWNNTHFCDVCHKPGVWQGLVVKMKGENKKEIWNYKQCPSLVPLINNIRNNRSLNTAQKLVAFKALRSDKKTCPSKIRHPPNGLEYGLGCSMCADNDNDEANAEASLRAREEKKEKLFTHSRDMDTNGVLYFLGTKRNTARWINPVDLGVVKVTSSELDAKSEPARVVVGRQAVRCVTQNAQNQWFIINLKSVKVRPTKYTLRHYSTWDQEALRNWRFAGSVDGKAQHWDTLIEHKNDMSLTRKGQTATWTVPASAAKKHYSYFCIIQTGKNSNNNMFLALSGFEVYGSVILS